MIAMMMDMKGETEELRKAYRATHATAEKLAREAGVILHTAGPTKGGWRIIDVWPSREAFEKFAEKLMPVASQHFKNPIQPQIWEIESNMNVPAR